MTCAVHNRRTSQEAGVALGDGFGRRRGAGGTRFASARGGVGGIEHRADRVVTTARERPRVILRVILREFATKADARGFRGHGRTRVRFVHVGDQLRERERRGRRVRGIARQFRRRGVGGFGFRHNG